MVEVQPCSVKAVNAPASQAAADSVDPAAISRLRAVLLRGVQQALHSQEAEALLGELVGADSLDRSEAGWMKLRKVLVEGMAQAYYAAYTGYAGSRLRCGCGRTARFVRYASKRITLGLGEVTLQRAEYACPSCGSFRPLDTAWDLPQGRYSRAVVRLVSLVGAEMPFARAAEMLWQAAGLSVSATEVRILCERVGEKLGEQKAAEVEAAEAGELRHPPAADVLILASDGAHVNTREEGWKETKVAVAVRCQRDVEADGRAVLRTQGAESTAHLGRAEAFGRELYWLACRQGERGREATLFLGDGSPWIWNLADELFPHARKLLDFYHLAEHVHQTARELHGEGTEGAIRWAEGMLSRLRAGEVDRVLAELSPPGSPMPEPLRKLAHSLEANRSRMDYPSFERAGYPIGSGVVESACKQVVHARHRQAGMRWGKAHVQKMLDLVCCLRSHRWEAFWATKPAVA